MSDPLKTSDIEDVLSSIRRLVSEEARPKSTSAAAPETGKLVLTPALRVQGPDRVADVNDTAEGHQDGSQPDDAGQADAPLILDSALENDEPELEAQAFGQSANETDPAALEWEDHEPAQPEPSVSALSMEGHAPHEPDPDDEAADNAAQDAEPDWSGTLYEAAGVTSEQAPDAPEMTPAQSSEGEGQFDFLAEDDGLIDEEALRELVSEIVRQELQGALGERITRNVRKLVRREIHRALSAQEFD